MAVDFTIIHPLSGGIPVIGAEGVARVLSGAEALKTRDQTESCAVMGWGNHPAAFTPWGAMGPGALSLAHEVEKRLTSDCDGWTKRSRGREMRQALSLTLARAVAQQLDLRVRVSDMLASAPAFDSSPVAPLLALPTWPMA